MGGMPRRRGSKSRGRPKEAKGKSKLTPIRYDKPLPKRNEPCSCGSKIKYKKCCGRPTFTTIEDKSPYTPLGALYTPEQQEAQAYFVQNWGFTPTPAQLHAFMEGDTDRLVQMVTEQMRMANVDSKWIEVVQRARRLVTYRNRPMLSAEILQDWQSHVDAVGAETLNPESKLGENNEPDTRTTGLSPDQVSGEDHDASGATAGTSTA